MNNCVLLIILAFENAFHPCLTLWSNYLTRDEKSQHSGKYEALLNFLGTVFSVSGIKY